MEKNFRVHTNVGSDTLLHVDMKQDFDFLEVLSLKLRQSDAYRLHSSNYGVIVGRVLANDAFGIPNAKVSIFIERDSSDTADLERIYPYSEVLDKDNQGRRYNLLPDYSDDKCYRVVGTFPNKRFLLDNETYIDVYEKYWKYTTITNSVGDYMIFGVPSGSQQLHVDIDLSDIGILSQRPRDFEYKGYNITQFDNSSQFKESTNLDNLSQIFSQNKGITVYPFWGDGNNGPAAITRSDVQIQYKFEPTCVFMGSIISDNDTNSIGHKCAPSVNTGKNNQLVAGEGTIEMIRVTTDGLVEDYQIQGNRLIDSDGVWCYQIPMNLDYIGMDEYGNIVATNDPSKGIPTRTRVRFRISKTESGEEGFSRHTAKYLVPNNPEFADDVVIPKIKDPKRFNRSYIFGSSTPRECFRDLYWNNVYSVKNYIPKTQVAHRATSKNYNSLKSANFANDKNTLPFNKLFIDVKFSYMIICILFKIVMVIITIVNWVIKILMGIKYLRILRIRPFKRIIPHISCIPLSAGLSDGNTAYYPGCGCPGSQACKHSDCPDDAESGKCKKSSDNKELMDKIQQNLAIEYELVNLDLQNDWINGALYMPLWYWRKAKKKRFLFWTIRKAKNEFCSCEKKYSRMKTYLTCDFKYKDNSLGHDFLKKEQKWHKNQKKGVWFPNGLIKPVENKDGLTVYYYASANPRGDQDPKNNPGKKTVWYDDIEKYEDGFYAVRLFATDIILLGSLWENNMYGIPQLFKNLPSTTSNVPAIATIIESKEDVDDDNTGSEAAVEEEEGTVVTTGMDWGYKGKKQNPKFSSGLFIDLTCTAARTYEKSCVNVERLSEYGVTSDMSYSMPYAKGGDIQYGEILPDGFISKYELDDTENRAMFATMNHVGFYPQDTKEIVGRLYDTQVDDKHTRYPIPKMEYIYPVDFDGRMDASMREYTSANTFKQLTRENADQAYLTFRLGGESNNTNTRMRHFYFASGSEFRMPVFNNSFYFYFGANKGNTAIEKFHKLFWADCFQNQKHPFSIVVEKNPKSYCPDAYSCNKLKYGYIRVILEDILTDYSYTLYDEYNRVVISEQMMTERDFVIGGTIDASGNVETNENGVVLPQAFDNVKTVSYIQDYVLENGTYRLSITDVNGKTVTERISLEQPKISLSYTTTDIGTRFYDTERTNISHICNDEYDFYGAITITGMFVDGIEYTFSGDTLHVDGEPERAEDGSSYTVKVSGSGDCVSDLSAIIRISLPEASTQDEEQSETDNFVDCMCDNDNRYSNGELVAESMGHDIESPYYYKHYDKDRIEFYVYQPNQYQITVTQLCNDTPMDETYDGIPNTTTSTVTIRSGEEFDVSLNTMPLRFMLGSLTDSKKLEVSRRSHFYGKVVQTSLDKSDLSGWFGVHHEQINDKADKTSSPYQFHLYPTDTVNEAIWDNYVHLDGGDINSVVSKGLIDLYKFRTMFSLSNGVYTTGEFEYQASGGTHPTLYRSVLPDYAGDSFYADEKPNYILGVTNSVTVLEDSPNIVTKYYDKMCNGQYILDSKEAQGPIWNHRYGATKDKTGNYFAAFTNNGGYSDSGEVLDKRKGVFRLPSLASVSPVDQQDPVPLNERYTSQEIGRVFKYAHTQGNQSLKGDKNRTVNPYLRALNVDRRIDFNLLIFGPILSKSFDINEENQITWKTGRVSGMTYNGIEMSYTNKDKNIIDANWDKYEFKDGTWTTASTATTDETEDTEVFYGATPNTHLEYSYMAASGNSDAYTVYNRSNDYAWERDNDPDKQINKRLYRAAIGANDVRDYFWSEGNEKRLRQCIAETAADDGNPITSAGINFCGYVGGTAYVFPHTASKDGYNGDFNMFQYRDNYPTKRLIDIGGLQTMATYNFNFTPCSYDVSVTMEDNGKITGEIMEDDEVEFSVNFSNPVTFTTPNADNQEYYNTLYKVKKIGDSCQGSGPATTIYNPTIFRSISSEIYFSPTQRSNDDFRIRVGAPRLIAVLPYPLNNSVDQHGSKDAITAIKLVTSKEQLYEKIGYQPTHEKSSIRRYLYTDKSGSAVLGNTKIKTSPKGVKLKYAPSVIDPNEYYMSLMNGEGCLYTDDTDTQATVFYSQFKSSTNENKSPMVYCVLLENEYEWQNEDGLLRGMRVIEFSDLIDVRNIELQCAIQSSDGVAVYSYLQNRNINNGFDNDEEGGGGGEEGGGEEGSGDTKVDKADIATIQFLAFNIHIEGGVDGTNQSFYDWENMSFAIKINDKYYINAYRFENGDRLPFFAIQKDTTVSIDTITSATFTDEDAVDYAEGGQNPLVTAATTSSSCSWSVPTSPQWMTDDSGGYYIYVKYDLKITTTECTANSYSHSGMLDFKQNAVSERTCDSFPDIDGGNTKEFNMSVWESGIYSFSKAIFTVTATTYTSTTIDSAYVSSTTLSAQSVPYVLEKNVTDSSKMENYVRVVGDIEGAIPSGAEELLSYFSPTSGYGKFTGNGACKIFAVDSHDIPVGNTVYSAQTVHDSEMIDDDGVDIGHVPYTTISSCPLVKYQIRVTNGEAFTVSDEREYRKIQNVLVHFILSPEMNTLQKMAKNKKIPCKFYAKTASNYTYCMSFNIKIEDQVKPGEIEKDGPQEGTKGITYIHII